MMDRLIAIVGPTGVGKSQLALRLAGEFDGEIVSADSRQVYRQMDIGTAKPTREERDIVPHHLIDIADPDEAFSLADYQRLAYEAIQDIQKRGKLPFLVGGTGLYVRAVLEGWEIPRVAPNPALRQELESRAAAGERDRLYQELRSVDPNAASKIDPRNIRRVIRALEVTRTSGSSFSSLQRKKPQPFQAMVIGLTASREELYRRADSRVDRMIEMGLIDEVKTLLQMGYSRGLPSMSGIGYKEICAYLSGEMTLEQATQRIKHETHRFIRHQFNWFRLTDPAIRWFDVQREDTFDKVLRLVREFAG